MDNYSRYFNPIEEKLGNSNNPLPTNLFYSRYEQFEQLIDVDINLELQPIDSSMHVQVIITHYIILMCLESSAVHRKIIPLLVTSSTKYPTGLEPP